MRVADRGKVKGLAEKEQASVLHILPLLLKIIVWEVVTTGSELMVTTPILVQKLSEAACDRRCGRATTIGFVTSIRGHVVAIDYDTASFLSLLYRFDVLLVRPVRIVCGACLLGDVVLWVLN
jgi:hypothetical protein